MLIKIYLPVCNFGIAVAKCQAQSAVVSREPLTISGDAVLKKLWILALDPLLQTGIRSSHFMPSLYS